MIYPIPRNDIPRVWVDEARELLLPAIERYGRGLYREIDVWMGLASRHMQLWVADGGACVTQVAQYPQKRVLGLLFVGGKERFLWMHHLQSIEQWARANGIQELEGYPREGWLRNLPVGWCKSYRKITKAL